MSAQQFTLDLDYENKFTFLDLQQGLTILILHFLGAGDICENNIYAKNAFLD